MIRIQHITCATVLSTLVLSVCLAGEGGPPASQPKNVAASQPASQPASGNSMLDQMSKKLRKAPPKPAAAKAPTSQPAAKKAGSGSVLDQMQKEIQANPALEPTQRQGAIGKPGPVIHVGVDRKLIQGIAPGMPAPKLRREGDFVVNRRGRLKLTPSGNYALFAFDSDGTSMADPPMVLVPCELLELMEKQVQDRGERIVFKISGQILTYHHVNYLLPTMVKLDVDRGNLGN